MEQQTLTARQRMNMQIASQRRALLTGKAKVNAARKQLEAAIKMLEIAEENIHRGEVIDMDLPDIISHIREIASCLEESEAHIDRHVKRKKL